MLPAALVSKNNSERKPFHRLTPLSIYFLNIADVHTVFVFVAPLQPGAKEVSIFPVVCLSLNVRPCVHLAI